jgi:phthiodiolone/phenolphthiodiolone dimycocerosates ketoreductase
MRREVAALVDNGVDTVWWPDHLMSFTVPGLWNESEGRRLTDLNVYVDPFIAMAACIPAAGSALLGVAVTDAIRRMPATLTQTALSLDHIAPGRIILGLGSGERLNYEPYGWQVDSPNRRLDEAARDIRSFLADPGPRKSGAMMALRPAEGSAGPKLWIAAHGPKGYQTLGRYADGWLPFNLNLDEWTAGREQIRVAAKAAGRDPDAVEMGMTFLAVIQDDHEAAHSLLRHPAIKVKALHLPSHRFEAHGVAHPRGGSDLKATIATLMPNDVAQAANAVPFELVHEMMPHGTAAEVAQEIQRYGGLQHAKVHELSPVASPAESAQSVRRLGELARILHEI